MTQLAEDRLREEAHIWKIRMDGGLEASERAEFEQWIATDVHHREAYTEAEMFATAFTIVPDLAHSRSGDQMDWDNADLAVSLQERGRFAMSSRASITAGLATLALVCLLVVTAVLTIGPWSAAEPTLALHETPRATTRFVDLPDGSRLTLAPETRLELALSKNERRVRLIEGEVFSTVVANPERPFLVETSRGSVRVTGTKFEVVARGDKHSVAVAEGSVQAMAKDSSANASLTKGERVRFVSNTALSDIDEVFEGELASWRFGKLSFVRAEFRELIEDFNRYSERPVTVDPDVAGQIVTGTFDARDISSALKSLEEILPITVEDDGETIRISTK